MGLAEDLYWQLYELEPRIDTKNFSCYPVSFVVKAIKACQRGVNTRQFAQAVNALEFFYANSSKDGPKRTITDYLPYSMDDNKVDEVFNVFTPADKQTMQKLLDDFMLSTKTHGTIYALGWTDH